MNKPIIKFCICGLTLLIILTIIHSCRKDTKTAIAGEVTLDEAKAWYQQSYPATASSGVITRNLTTHSLAAINHKFNYVQYISPDWKHSTSYTRFNAGVVELPIDASSKVIATALGNSSSTAPVYNAKYSRSSFLIIKDSTGYHAYIMTLIADSAYLNGDLTKLVKNTYNKNDPNFSGVVLYHTPDGGYMNGWIYQNGSISTRLPVGEMSQSRALVGSTSTETPTYAKAENAGGGTTRLVQLITTCTTWTETNSVPECASCTPDVVDLGTTCSTIEIDGGSGNGGFGSTGGTGTSTGSGSGQAPPSPCTVPSSTSTTANALQNQHIKTRYVQQPTPPVYGPGFPPPTTPPANPCITTVTSITNNVTNPCLKAVVDNLVNNGTLQTGVTDVLRNTFGINDQVNLTFGQGTLTGSNSSNTAITDGSSANNFDITFNTPQIANASKEYLLETAMHEVFHAYLYENPSARNGLSQHTYMIQNYVSTEVATLQQVFPSLSTHDAECLVLGGYSDIDPTTLSAALSLCNLTQNDVATTNNNYKTGASGTHC